MRASRLLGFLSVALVAGAAFGQRLPQTIDDGQRNAIEAFVRHMAGGTPTRIVCPATNAWYVSSDLYGPLWFGADLLNANGEGAWRIVFENNARWNIVASEAAALEGGEQDPVALSMGYQNADGVQAQIGLAMLSAGQISNPEWWGFLTSESDPVAMSQGFVTGAPWQSEGYLTSLSGRGTSELNNDSGFISVSGDLFGLGSGFNIYGYAYGTEGRIPDYEQDRVAMSQGFVTPSAVGASDVSSMAYVDGNGVLQCAAFMNPSAYEFDPVAMSQGFVSFAGGTEGDLIVVSGGGLGTADPGTTIAAVASAQGFLTGESDPVAMAAGFITASFPGAQDGDLVVVAGSCSSLSSMEPTTWLASHENDPIAMSQGFLTSVPWDASVAYASEAGYAGSANSAYSAEECSSWGGWSHVAIQGNGGQPTVGDMIFMSDGGLTMLSQYNISTPNPPVFLGSEWHDGIGNMPKWLLQSDMQAGYATVSGSTSNVVSGVGQNFSFTNAFAGVTQVVVFADGVVTNRFKIP